LNITCLSYLNHFLKYIQVLDWSEEQSQEAALVRCQLMQLGQPIGHYDTLIAAHARSLKATLVAHNVREFERVQGLLLEDWELWIDAIMAALPQEVGGKVPLTTTVVVFGGGDVEG
jgi:predicted nucleic acid-binding protein